MALRELDLTTAQAAELAKGTASVFLALRKEYCNRLEIFEQYALEEILRVPPGLLMQTVRFNSHP